MHYRQHSHAMKRGIFCTVSMAALSCCERPTKRHVRELASMENVQSVRVCTFQAAAGVTTNPLRNLDPLSDYFHSPPPPQSVWGGGDATTNPEAMLQETYIGKIILCRIMRRWKDGCAVNLKAWERSGGGQFQWIIQVL